MDNAEETVREPDAVIEPPKDEKLIDASRVFMMVGDERGARPMSLPQIFQEMFAILGDVDKRLRGLENPKERPSGLILPD